MDRGQDPHAYFRKELERSRKKLLGELTGADSVVFITGSGNTGDKLIFAGTRALLSGKKVRECRRDRLPKSGGAVAAITGSGGWCKSYHSWPAYLPEIEARFDKVVVLPSSFDLSEPSVFQALRKTRAKVFARERVSYKQIRDWCDADLAFDCAFFFPFSPYRTRGKGVLHAYRTDRDALGHPVPKTNVDVSAVIRDLDEWLRYIARFERVKTDRAHVMIAAAMLGKQVEYRATKYHKVPAIADYSLRGFPVRREE